MVRDKIWETEWHADSQTIPCFLYGTRRIITVFTKGRQWNLPSVSRIQFFPFIPISKRCILMLSSHVRLCFPNGLFHSGHPTKGLETALPSSMRDTWPIHLNLLDLITLTIIGQVNRPWNSSLCNFFHNLYSSILGPNINILFRKNSTHVHPSKWETKFRTHTVQLVELQLCIY